jgi:hypothetical protein
MLTQDYLVRMLVEFAGAVMRTIQRANDERDPEAAADMLEGAVGEATDLDAGALLSLSPDSIAQIMQVSGVDPAVTEYMARSLALASEYRRQSGNDELAELRLAQAHAIADAYGCDISDMTDQCGNTQSVEAAMQDFLQ